MVDWYPGKHLRRLRERVKERKSSAQIADHKKEQIKAILERHIPPLETDWKENAEFYRKRFPPDYEIVRFYEDLLAHLQELKRKYEAELRGE